MRGSIWCIRVGKEMALDLEEEVVLGLVGEHVGGPAVAV